MAAPEAIPTFHSGTLFRSRLEARWAFFFDQIGVAWRYEPEAFRLRSGEGYVPDFHLPTLGNALAEVKPSGGDPFAKARALAQERRWPMLLLGGLPSRHATLVDGERGSEEFRVRFQGGAEVDRAVALATSERRWGPIPIGLLYGGVAKHIGDEFSDYEARLWHYNNRPGVPVDHRLTDKGNPYSPAWEPDSGHEVAMAQLWEDLKGWM